MEDKDKTETTIEIKDIDGNVIFSHTCEYNTVAKTVEKAVEDKVSLREADLYWANLYNTNLRGANLSGANLRKANLRKANLYGANLYGANLSWVNLHSADLREADLDRAIFNGAILNKAIFNEANLSGADLSGADISGADFRDACLTGAQNIPYMPLACPSEGSFIGWKKIKLYREQYNGHYLVKLEIPEDAKRCSATSSKCRCDKAKVLEIANIETGEKVDIITNINEAECVYMTGEMVYPDSFDDNRWNECSHGIHFFTNRQDAINYGVR